MATLTRINRKTKQRKTVYTACRTCRNTTRPKDKWSFLMQCRKQTASLESKTGEAETISSERNIEQHK